MTPAAKIALIRQLVTRISDMLETADLTGPSACPAWDVGTTAAHITGGAMRQCDSMRRGLNGQHGPPDGNPTVTTPDEVQQRNAVSNQQLREEFGEDLLLHFHDAYATLDDLLQSWTDWTIGCWHHRRGTMSAESYLDLRIQELVIHDWDMRSGGTGQAEMDAEGVAALLPASEMWYELCFRPTTSLQSPIIYQFNVGLETPEARLQHDVILQGDTFSVETSTNMRSPDLTITCSAETYLLCLYGRVDWATAWQDGRLSVTSSRAQPPDHDLRWFHERFGGL